MGFLIEEDYGFLGLRTRTIYVETDGIFLMDRRLNKIGKCTDPSKEVLRAYFSIKKNTDIINDWLKK